MNHISGDYSIIEKVDKSTRENYNNVFHGNAVIVSSGRGRQEQEHSYGPSGNGFGYDPNTGLPGRGWARVRGRYIGASGAGPGMSSFSTFYDEWKLMLLWGYCRATSNDVRRWI